MTFCLTFLFLFYFFPASSLITLILISFWLWILLSWTFLLPFFSSHINSNKYSQRVIFQCLVFQVAGHPTDCHTILEIKLVPCFSLYVKGSTVKINTVKRKVMSSYVIIYFLNWPWIYMWTITNKQVHTYTLRKNCINRFFVLCSYKYMFGYGVIFVVA